MSASSLIFEIIGIDHASKEFDRVSRAMGKTEDRSKKLKIAGGIALAALAASAVEFGKKSVDKFQEVGTQTLALQRVMGGTAQQASRLRFAAEETGVASDQLGVSMKFLAKFMNNTQDAAYKQFTALDKTNVKLMAQKRALEAVAKPTEAQRLRLETLTKTLTANGNAQALLGINTSALGIKITDASGNMLPMNTVLLETADIFAKMPAGAEKTALAIKVFGKSGAQLLPFLNKGAAGLKELGIESDKYGDTLNAKDTAAVYRNIIAKRQLGAAISGLEIQLGQKLLPIVTSVVSWVTRTVLWFSKLSTTTKDVIKVVVAVVAVIALVVRIVKIWTAVQAALNLVLDANPIGLVIIAVAALAAGFIYAYKHSATFRNIVNGAFHGIAAAGQWMWKILKPIFHALVAAFDAAKAAASWVSSIAGGGGPSAAGVVAGNSHPGNTGFHGSGKAFGGPVRKGIPYVVGEVRRELFVPDQDGTIVPQLPAMSSRGGGDIHVTAPLVVQVEGRAIYQGLLTFKRRNGIVSLAL